MLPKIRKSFTIVRAIYVHKKSKIQFEYKTYRLNFKIKFDNLYSNILCKRIESLLIKKNNISDIFIKITLYKCNYYFI